MGSVASTMGVAAPIVAGPKVASVGAKVLGLTGKTLGTRARNMALSGAGISAADTVARGGDVEDVAINSLIGGGIGGGIPLAGAAVRAGYNTLAKTVGSVFRPQSAAKNSVAEALRRDAAIGANMPKGDIPQARTNGQPITVGDVGGENTRALARNAANISPDARQTMSELSARFGTQYQRATDFVSGLVHGKVDDLAFQDGLKESARRLNAPRYAKAYSNPKAQSMWDDDFAQLMQSPAIQSAAKGATGRSANQAALTTGAKGIKNPFVFADDGGVSMQPGIAPNLQFWDHVKRGLDDAYSVASRQGNRAHAADINSLRKALVQKLDRAVPEFKKARSGAAAFFGAEDALDAGRKAVNLRRKNGEIARHLMKMNAAEKEAFKIGYASELTDKIRSAGERTNVINSVFGNPEAKTKLETVLGRKALKELEAFVRIENAMKMLQTAVEGGSSTTRQLMELGAGGIGGGLYTGDATGAIAGAGLAGGRRMVQNKFGREIAEVLMSKDPKMIEALVKKAGSNLTTFSTIKKFEKMISAATIGTGVAVGNLAVNN